MRKPGASFADVYGECADALKAAYRFCENDAVDFDKLMVPTWRVIGRRVRESEEQDILCIEDTTELDLSHMKAAQGFGEIGNPLCSGLFLHSGLAVTTEGVPLGLLSAQTWTRDPEDHGKAALRHERPFEQKETFKWWKAIEIAEGVVAKKGQLVHVCDSFADVFGLFARSQASGSRLLVRAHHDRQLASGASLWAQVSSWPILERRAHYVPAQPAREQRPPTEARDTTLSIRFGRVRVSHSDGELEMSAILVQEAEPAVESDALEWLLLTTDELHSTEDAWKRVDWYCRRWLIEEMHKCLKSACAIEERQFKDRQHFENALALNLLTSVRILQLRNLARAEPDLPARVAFTQDELAVIRAKQKARGKSGRAVLTLAEAVLMVARFGGYVPNKRSPPGFITLWRGYAKLQLLTEGFRLAMAEPSSRSNEDSS